MRLLLNTERERITALTDELCHPQSLKDSTVIGVNLGRVKFHRYYWGVMILLAIVTGKIFFGLIGTCAVSIITLMSIAVCNTIAASHRWKSIEMFERDYPAFLLSVSSAVKTGLDPLDAIFLGDEIFAKDSVMSIQARKVATAINEGVREHDAIRRFADDVPHPDVKLFHDTFIIARECGASIAPALSRLAKFTRQRQSFRRRARGAVAMQRLSSYGIIGCCLAIGAIQTIANPHSVSLALHSSLGEILLGTGGFLMLMGMVWMLYLTRRQI